MTVYAIEDMCKSKMGKRMQHMRAERPDEWTMDEFIRGVEIMASALREIAEMHIESHEDVRSIQEIAKSALDV